MGLMARERTSVNWQTKLGIIVPSWNTVMEYEFQRMAGPSTSVHSQRIKHTDDSEKACCG